MTRRLVLAAALALAPGAASAHAAFGDLGPFYASLLHPLADPGQGLLVAATAVLLARQPLAALRAGYAALAAGGLTGILLRSVLHLPAPGEHAAAAAAAVFGAAALFRLPLAPVAAATLAALAGAAAGLAIDLPPGLHAGVLALLGGAIGIALAGLMVWGLVDALQRRLGMVAGAVAGSWIAAIGIMVAALPG